MEFGAYRTERLLADGPLSAVYQGVHAHTRKQVLLHVLRPPHDDAARRYDRLQAQARLLMQHPIPGVPALLAVGQGADGAPYVVTEFAQGETLAAMVAKGGQAPVPTELALHIGRQLAQTLAAAHAHGIAHGALTPDHVLIAPAQSPPAEQGVWLLGWGLAEICGDAEQRSRSHADVFALGAILSELLKSAALSPELSALLKEMTASSPSERPTMSAVATHLGAAVPVEPGAADATIKEAGLGDAPIGTLFGSFRVTRKLSAGGMGVVYEAEHQKIGRRAVVKVLHPDLAQDEEFAQRFLNEARAVNIIRHRGLVEIFDFGKRPDGTLYYVMEFLEGESLLSRIEKRRAPFPPAEAVGLAVQIARALAEAHAKGVIHRDLKPENIMLEPDPVSTGREWVKILDFGIAKVLTDAAVRTDPGTSRPDPGPGTTGTHVGSYMGTPLYMAPEQAGRAEQVDGKADVFSLGMVLYELLAGRLPLSSNTLGLLSRRPAPLHKQNLGVSKRLAILVDKMTAGKPAERPTMQAVADELSRLAASSPVSKKRLLLLGGLAGLGLAALALLLTRFYATPTEKEIRSRALAVLAGYLQDRDVNVRIAAVRALGQSRDVEQRVLLEPLLQIKDAALQEEAARALGQVGAMDARPALLTLTAESLPPSVQVAAAGTLAQLQHPRGAEVLKRLLDQGDDYGKVHAALLLLERGDASGASLLWAGLGRGTLTPDNKVQILSRLALTGDAQAKERLSEELQQLVAGDARMYVAYSLARLGEEEGWQRLKQEAARPGPEQLLAQRLLAGLGEPGVRPQLLKLAVAGRQPDSVRELALAGLADSAGEDSAALSSALAPVLTERGASARVRIAAAGAILQLLAGERARLGEQSLSWARAALGSDSVATRELAVAVLGEIHSEQTIAPLGLALKDGSQAVRRGAASALGSKINREALQALQTALDDEDPQVRAAGMQSTVQVIKALRQRGDRESARQILPALRKLARSGSERDRLVASGSLLQLGEVEPSDAQHLRSSLHAKDGWMRKLAVELADPDEQTLVKLLADGDRSVRLAAARRLAARGSHSGVAVLREAAAIGDADGLWAYSALRKLGEAVLPPPGLLALFRKSDLATRMVILDALAELSPESGLLLLQQALLDPVAVVRRRAADLAAAFYRQTRQRRFLQIVRSLQSDPEVIVRAQVAALLVELVRLPSQPGEPAEPPADKPAPKSSPAPAALKGQSETRSASARSSASSGSGSGSGPGAPTAEQLWQESRDAIEHKDPRKAQEGLERLRRLLGRNPSRPSQQADLFYLQARLYEKSGRLDEAISEYNRCLNVPAAQRRSELNSTLQTTLSRLSGKVSRIQIYTLVDGTCRMSRELLGAPGEHVVSLGKGQTRTVFSQVGSITKVMACK